MQYRETAFDFVSRLMEDEGIFYFFRHEASKHTMVLADDKDSHKACPGPTTIYYKPRVSKEIEYDAMLECSLEQQVVSGKYQMTDYNFETPTTSLLVTATGEDQKKALFEYPGGFDKKNAGEKRAKIRIDFLSKR